MDDIGPIYMDEAAVPAYVLPPLEAENVADWESRRRPVLLDIFRTQVYGRTPDVHVRAVPTESAFADALGGIARRKQTRVELRHEDRTLPFELLLYLPRDAPRPTPVFLGLNFFGNHSVHADPGIWLTPTWLPNDTRAFAPNHTATDEGRGCRASHWCVEEIVRRGYGLATVYYGDFDPDYDDGFHNGAHGFIEPEAQRTPESWGAIGAWAWGLSRALDALELDADVDAQRVAAMGHSRLGKAALWAGVQDPRFAMVISNNSGCGGAALFRRTFGETIRAIVTRFPHWFARNLATYTDRDNALPFDMHQLLALVAPRPLYVASASQDLWADPLGEFLAAREASHIWSLYDLPGLALTEMPDVGQADTTGYVGYHLREGVHAVTAEDWARYCDFADRNL